MNYSHEVEKMVCVKQGPNHGPAPIPEEGNWVQAKEIKDISGLSHGIGWCAPQQGTKAHIKRNKRNNSRGAGTDARQFPHDAFCAKGGRNLNAS